MSTNFQHAYNYWRKVFVETSDGRFSNEDFDRWFRGGAKPVADSFGYFGTVEVDNPGSKEHFNQVVRQAFIDMLNACSDRRFGH